MINEELHRDKIEKLNACEIFIGLISTQMRKKLNNWCTL